MLRAKLKPLTDELEALSRTAEAFPTREAELATAIGEAATDEERTVVENNVTEFEAEKTANATRSAELRNQIEALEAEIRTAEEAAESARRAAQAPAHSEREVKTMYNVRAKMFGATAEEQQAFVARDDVKEFLQRVRSFKGQKRAVSGAELGIPTVFLELMRPEIERQSKLLPRIHLERLGGQGRQNVMGEVPEAIWIEAVGALNELDVIFTQLELDRYGVGGFIAIPNCYLDETTNDLDLAAALFDAIAGAIAKAADKAAVYGTGVKMPVGFVTRLACTNQPAWWGSHQGAFTDLHTSHVLKLNIAAADTVNGFFMPLLRALGKADPKYSDGKATWIMNHKTHVDIMVHALGMNLNAAIVAGMSNQMPIIGGDIIEEEFMADYEIAGGFLSTVRWSERDGAVLDSSDQPMWIQNQTVFKGISYYDGKPARGESTVIVNYNNTDPTTALSFAIDYANTAMNTLIVTAAAGAATGKTVLTVSGAKADSPALKYLAKATTEGIKVGDTVGSDWTDLTSGSTAITAAAGTPIAVVELDADGKVVSTGNVLSIPKTA